MSLHFHPLRVARVTPDTDEAVLIDFEVPPDLREAFAFEPGQYLTLRHDIDGEDLRRSYSICAGLDDGRVWAADVTGERLVHLKSEKGPPITALALSPDAKRVAWGDEDGNAGVAEVG